MMVEKTDCSGCSKAVVIDGLQCDQCEKWFHISCESISGEEYKVLGGIKSVWFCTKCSNVFRENKSIITKEDKSNQTELVDDTDIQDVKAKSEASNNFDEVKMKEMRDDIVNDISKCLPILFQQEMKKFSITAIEELKKSNKNEEKCAKALLENMARLEEKQSIVVNEVKSQNNSINQKFASYASVLNINKEQNTETERAITSISKGIETLHTKISDEAEKKLIKEKANNVCVFNLPESPKSDQNEAIKDDIAMVKKIIDPNSEIKKEDVQCVYRMGVKSSDKIRTLVIKFHNIETRRKVLSLRNLFYEAENKPKVKIFIAPDRTPKQREEHKKVYEELKKRKEKGETDLYIKNGEILKYVKYAQPFRYSSQSNWE